MASTKLLFAEFKSLSGDYTVTVGSNSMDKLDESTNYLYSKDYPMNQTGCAVCNGFLSDLEQPYLYKELDYQGYGSNIALLKDSGEKDVKLYLNGQAFDGDNIPQPYVMFVNTDFPEYKYTLHYFTADNTDLGVFYRFPSNIQNACGIVGHIYDDGMIRGDWQYVRMKPHYFAGIPSNKYYEWMVNSGTHQDYQIIPEEIIEDLQEYLPTEPEGSSADNRTGAHDGTSDPIPFPDLPSANAIDTGMCSMYNMTNTQLRSLSSYLWTTDFWENIKKMFNDPMESILDLSIMPVTFSGLTTSTIKIGNIITTVSGYKLNTPYKIIDFGTMNMDEYYGNFADYSPYTKVSIFLPYIGVQQISVDDIAGGVIHLKAYCDCLTGSVQYMLHSTQYNPCGRGHASVLYTWGGNMKYQVPLSASNFSSVVSSLISTAGTIAGGIAGSIATDGAVAPIAVGTIASSVGSMANAKTHVQRGGGLGGAVGLFGIQYPYLILEIPEEVTDAYYPHNVGIPKPKTDVLINNSGFAKIKEAHIEINNATDNEINNIISLLKEGVII